MTDSSGDIKLARDGDVTYRNFSRLGYERLLRGVYGQLAPVEDPDKWQARRRQFLRRVHAVMAAYPGTVILCGVTALQVLGVALPSHLEDWQNCHVIVAPGAYRPQRRGVIAHRSLTPPQAWRLIDGLPVLHPVDCWLQLRGASDNDLIEVGDGFLRKRKPLLTLDAMNRRLNQLTGVDGVKRARSVMRWLRPRTESIYETRIRLLLVRAGLPCPLVDHEVFCPSVGRAYHLDMGYDEEKIGVEYDGRDHVKDTEQMEIDATRRRHLQDEAWMLITITAGQLKDERAIVRSVEAALVLRRAANTNAW